MTLEPAAPVEREDDPILTVATLLERLRAAAARLSDADVPRTVP